MFNTYHRKNVGLQLCQYDGKCKFTRTLLMLTYTYFDSVCKVLFDP